MILDFLSDPTDFNEEMAILDRMKSCGMDIILKTGCIPIVVNIEDFFYKLSTFMK